MQCRLSRVFPPLHSLIPASRVGKMGGRVFDSRPPLIIQTFTLTKASPPMQKFARLIPLETDTCNLSEEEEPCMLPSRLQCRREPRLRRPARAYWTLGSSSPAKDGPRGFGQSETHFCCAGVAPACVVAGGVGHSLLPTLLMGSFRLNTNAHTALNCQGFGQLLCHSHLETTHHPVRMPPLGLHQRQMPF